MSKANWLSILRSVLLAVGAYFTGQSFLGNTIDNNLWLGITTSIGSIVVIVWGIVDKTATVEMVNSLSRSVVIFFGTMLVGAGIIKDEVLQSLLLIVSTVIPVIISQNEKKKNIDVAKGKLGIADLAGVKPEVIPIRPVVETPKDNNK